MQLEHLRAAKHVISAYMMLISVAFVEARYNILGAHSHLGSTLAMAVTASLGAITSLAPWVGSRLAVEASASEGLAERATALSLGRIGQKIA